MPKEDWAWGVDILDAMSLKTPLVAKVLCSQTQHGVSADLVVHGTHMTVIELAVWEVVVTVKPDG